MQLFRCILRGFQSLIIFKMKYLIFILLFIPSTVFAFDGEIWVGKYFSNDYPSNPGFTSPVLYEAGVELGYTFKHDDFTIRPRFEINTLMDERDNFNFHPSGAQYFAGVRLTYKRVYVDFEHLCWHPVDTGGPVYEYDRIRVGIEFGR